MYIYNILYIYISQLPHSKPLGTSSAESGKSVPHVLEAKRAEAEAGLQAGEQSAAFESPSAENSAKQLEKKMHFGGPSLHKHLH